MLISQQFNLVANQNLGRAAWRYLGKEQNYHELRQHVARLSYLYQNELGQGARVAFLTDNSPSVISTFLALSNTRSMVIPIDPRCSPEEIMAWIKESKATHLAVTPGQHSRARDIFQTNRTSLPIIEIEKKHGGEYDSSFTPPADNKPIETDQILLLRTAGTTGKPKLVPLTHKQIHHAAISLRSAYHFQPTDRVHTTMHWSHPYAFVHGMLLPVLLGSTCVIEHGIEMGLEYLDHLIDGRISRLVGTPPFFLKLLMTCKAEQRTLPGVKSVTVGLGMLNPALRKVFETLKIGVIGVYGQTENVWTIGIQDSEASEADGSMKGLPGVKYRVIDENGDEIPGRDKRVGQLAVMGPTVMEKGYLDRERETKTSIRGTWLYTGDFARLEGDGETLKVQFLARKDDVVKLSVGKGSDWTTMAPVDGILRGITGVVDACAFVQKNGKGEQFIAAAVVKVNNSALNEKQILEACTAKLPAGIVPKVVAFTDALPREPGGSVNTSKLRLQFAGIGG